MTTVAQVAKRALVAIKVQGSESPLEGDDYEDFIESMNDFMAELESRSIVLGYTPVANLADEITIDPGAISGLVANMAIRVSPAYNGHISEALVVSADTGMNTMRALGMSITPSLFPSTLSTGVANQMAGDNTFYTGAE
jgi:hypothetical protein